MKKYLLQHILLNLDEGILSKVALIIDNKKYTYYELLNDIYICCKYFNDLHIERDTRIVIQDDNSYLLIVLFWSAILCGAIVSIFPALLNHNELSNRLKNFNPQYIFSKTKNFNENIAYISYEKVSNIISNTVSSNRVPNANVVSSDIVSVIYTSGSTGVSKGVTLTHDNMLSALSSIQDYLNIHSGDVIYNILPMYFDYGLYQMLLAFNVGATLLLDNGFISDKKFYHNLEKYSVSVIPIVPSVVSLLLKNELRNSQAYNHVRIITNTGEKITHRQITYLEKLFPESQIFSMFGLTECKRCTYLPPEFLHKKPNSIGVPMPNLRLTIKNTQNETVTTPYESGELYVEGPSIMKGYWSNPLETDKKLIFDNAGNKFLKTGDKCYFDSEGFYYFLGRFDHIEKFNGVKFDRLVYINLLEQLDNISRSHIFFDCSNDAGRKLYVCLEIIASSFNDRTKKKVLELFPLHHRPSCIYTSCLFPALPNGKINYKELETKAKGMF